jgi:arylsulfatase A-like enzyme
MKSMLDSHGAIMLVAAVLVIGSTIACWTRNRDPLPNIVYIMSDELGYYDVGYMGNKLLRTPRIDELASQGLTFTRALAVAPICAPVRACMMKGKHMGHCSVRVNDGGTPLRADEETIASMLQDRGYATGGFGKWGAGGRGSTGVPEKHGFDVFFGYYDQLHSQSYYPPYLIRNSEEVKQEGNIGGLSGKTYSHYEIMKEAIDFVHQHQDEPFFLYLPITPPHGWYPVPESDPAWPLFKDKDWKVKARSYAAMVTMVDRDVGVLMDLLEELGLDENTIVFFAGDNGGMDRFVDADHPRGLFGPNKNPETGVEFRGGKGSLYEGGLRIPSLVYWPGRIEPGRVSDLTWSQIDLFPTLTELTGGTAPDDLDGISILPTILGEEIVGREQELHTSLYWEYEGQIAVLLDDRKAVRPGQYEAWELYDLSNDVSETRDLSATRRDELNTMIGIAAASRVPADPGTYVTRSLHQRDRQARWGTAKPPPRKP